MGIAIVTEGRRYYFTGNTYPIKDQLRSAGAKWDPERKAWWTGKADVAERFAAADKATASDSSPGERQDERVGEDDRVIRGRARYEGKTYYVLAEGISRSSGRRYAKLCFRDGTRVFWAKDADAVEIVKHYHEPTTIGHLRAYAEKAKSYGTDACRCRCHSEPNAGRPGSTLYDGCDRCGCEAC